MNIFNEFRFARANASATSDLTGSKIVETEVDTELARLYFNDGQILEVGMSDHDYNGPEAMEFIEASGGKRIVWS